MKTTTKKHIKNYFIYSLAGTFLFMAMGLYFNESRVDLTFDLFRSFALLLPLTLLEIWKDRNKH